MTLFKDISQQTKLVAVFLLIVLIHIIFKSYQLTYSGFWYDETFGLFYSQQDWGLIKHTSEWDINAPLYYYFLWIWRNLFGISEFAIRFSSVLFSSLAAGMIYIFSTKYFNKTTAFIALLIYTSSNEMFFYAHEARCYSIIFFLTICSSYFYFNLLTKKSISSVILLGVINFLLVYANYLTGLVLAIQVLLTLCFFNKPFAKQIGIAFLITFLLAFWRFSKKTILLLLNGKKVFWLAKPTFYDLKNVVYDFFNGKEIFFVYLFILTALLIIFFTNKQRSYLKELITIKSLYILLCSVGVILFLFAASTITPLFTKRYAVYTIPFICVLIGLIVGKIINTKLKYITTGVICLISVYSFSKIDFRTLKPMNYRDAMVFTKKEKNPNTAILVESRDMRDLFNYYYDRTIFSDLKNMNAKMSENSIYVISNTEDLKGIDFTKYNKIILTQSFVLAGPENDNLLKTISAHYKTQTSNTNYTGVTIFVFSN
ncbi:MAG TPA: glycosyltransferase family 39 protein [Bacteroidia bacterium]|nr:glycosyltransferase family 39 protein [Bacteroidia bacterium]